MAEGKPFVNSRPSPKVAGDSPPQVVSTSPPGTPDIACAEKNI